MAGGPHTPLAVNNGQHATAAAAAVVSIEQQVASTRGSLYWLRRNLRALLPP